MKIVKNLIVLSVMWFAVWFIFAFAVRPVGINYIENFILAAAYFFIVTVLFYSLFHNQIKRHTHHFSNRDLYIVIGLYIISGVVFAITRALTPPEMLSNAKSLYEIYWLDDRVLVSKTFEIIFQQVFFIVAIDYLFKSPLSSRAEIFLFGVYAFVIHLPLIFLVSAEYLLFVLPAAFVSGIVFAYLITRFKDGFIYSYCVHFLFYVALASGYWLLS